MAEPSDVEATPGGDGFGGPALRRRLRRPDFLRITRVGSRTVTRYFIVFVASRGPAAAGADIPTASADPPGSGSSSLRSGPGSEPEVASGLARLGITVTRKVGNAVRRNRIKRLVREWFREANLRLGPYDVVVIAKREFPVRISQQRVARDLDRVLEGRGCGVRP